MSLLKKRTKHLNKLVKQLEEAAKNKTLVYVVDYLGKII